MQSILKIQIMVSRTSCVYLFQGCLFPVLENCLKYELGEKKNQSNRYDILLMYFLLRERK